MTQIISHTTEPAGQFHDTEELVIRSRYLEDDGLGPQLLEEVVDVAAGQDWRVIVRRVHYPAHGHMPWEEFQVGTELPISSSAGYHRWRFTEDLEQFRDALAKAAAIAERLNLDPVVGVSRVFVLPAAAL